MNLISTKYIYKYIYPIFEETIIFKGLRLLLNAARTLTDALFRVITQRVFGNVNPSRVVFSYPGEHYEGPRTRCSEKPHVSLMGAPTDGQYLSLCSPLLFCVIPPAGIPLVSLCITDASPRADVINICFDRQKLRLFKLNRYKYPISLK